MVTEENGAPKKRKLILLNGSKIMRSMLTRAIEERSDLIIDREILVDSDLVGATEGGVPLDADWVMTLETSNIIPQSLLDAADSNPHTRLIILATDGSQVIIRWFEEKTRVVDQLDLDKLMEILLNEE